MAIFSRINNKLTHALVEPEERRVQRGYKLISHLGLGGVVTRLRVRLRGDETEYSAGWIFLARPLVVQPLGISRDRTSLSSISSGDCSGPEKCTPLHHTGLYYLRSLSAAATRAGQQMTRE